MPNRLLKEPLDIHKYALRLRTRPKSNDLVPVRYCSRCGYAVAARGARHCPICAATSLMKGKAAEMIYKAIKLNENGKALLCPHCSNEELTPGDFCMICGNEIINRCADKRDLETDTVIRQNCRTVLPGNARYCFKCGNESTFYQKGWLPDWRSENTRKAIENIRAVDFKGSRTSG